VGDPESRPDRVGKRVIGAHEGVRERLPGQRGGVGHVGPSAEVARVVIHLWQGVEDEAGGLHTEGVGIWRGED